MSPAVIHDRESILAAVDSYEAALDTMAGLSFDALTHPDLLTVLDRLESLDRRTPTVGRRIITRLQHEASPVALGAKSWKSVLCQRLRISGTDAARRLAEAKDLGPRTAFSGEPMAPVRAKVAAAQAEGRIGPEHVTVIRGFFAGLPLSVDAETLEKAEDTLVRVASGLGPDELRKAAERLAALIDQDGPEPDDAERARKRTITIGKQQPDGMSKLSGWIDPQLRATFEPMTAKLAAPGMCNPTDPEPRSSGTPSQEQIDADDRSYGQRMHDAFTAIGRMVLMSGQLGQHNGLPVTVIVSTTLRDLQKKAGCAVTGGGSLVPMSDLIRMASHAIHYLVVFDDHTQEPLYLGRVRRLASVGQRIVLHSRDVGCTFPGCPVGGYGCQVHHVNGWAKQQGRTDIGELTLACGGDNRLAEEGWTTRIRNGIAEWTPPPKLDTGQTRVNFYHHPQRLLMDPDPEGDAERSGSG